MSRISTIFKNLITSGKMVFLAGMVAASAAHADGYTAVSTRAFQQALDANSSMNLYAPQNPDSGFKVNTSYFSGNANGVNNGPFDMNVDQKLYALLIDGRYDFNSDTAPILSRTSLRPYITGGMGMASTGVGSDGFNGGDNMSPMFRLGGGVAYRLGEQWDMSLDYKTGAAIISGDQQFTGRGQQAVDLQSLSLGMKYSF